MSDGARTRHALDAADRRRRRGLGVRASSLKRRRECSAREELARPRLQGAHRSRRARRRVRARAQRAAHLAARRLHVIALPNPDGSFTVTLFLPRARRAQLRSRSTTPRRSTRSSSASFADALPLMPDARRATSPRIPTASLGTVHAAGRWHLDGQRAAARRCRARHRAVPRPGHELRLRGLRRCSTSCSSRAPTTRRLARRVRASSSASARPNTARDRRRWRSRTTRDARCGPRRRLPAAARRLPFELERRFPERFIPRYSMVMFHPEIPYAEALRRGAVQARSARAHAGAEAPRTGSSRARRSSSRRSSSAPRRLPRVSFVRACDDRRCVIPATGGGC